MAISCCCCLFVWLRALSLVLGCGVLLCWQCVRGSMLALMLEMVESSEGRSCWREQTPQLVSREWQPQAATHSIDRSSVAPASHAKGEGAQQTTALVDFVDSNSPELQNCTLAPPVLLRAPVGMLTGAPVLCSRRDGQLGPCCAAIGPAWMCCGGPQPQQRAWLFLAPITGSVPAAGRAPGGRTRAHLLTHSQSCRLQLANLPRPCLLRLCEISKRTLDTDNHRRLQSWMRLTDCQTASWQLASRSNELIDSHNTTPTRQIKTPPASSVDGDHSQTTDLQHQWLACLPVFLALEN